MDGSGRLRVVSDPAGTDGFQVLADRVHRYEFPLERLYTALTEQRSGWLRLAPGEVEPRVLETVRPIRVVWSSFWPVGPNDRIELDLSSAGPPPGRIPAPGQGARPRTLLRMRWWTDSPPDARGIGITRQRLNLKFGGDLRGLVSEYLWHG